MLISADGKDVLTVTSIVIFWLIAGIIKTDAIILINIAARARGQFDRCAYGIYAGLVRVLESVAR